jgi:predicted dehydrogenase
MKQKLNIGIVGTRFMGKAHSNAFRQAPVFFDLPLDPVLYAACGTDKENLNRFSSQFGWHKSETSWRKMIADKEVGLIDICTPNNLHHEIAIAAAGEGKHILCEKPAARTVEEALRMYEAAAKAGVVNMIVFNYRFLPAIAHARKLIEDGKIGEIRHFNAVYYQDWLADPKSPYVWRNDLSISGSGAHGDMNAHTIDLARYLVGEIEEVNGIQKTFIRERPTQANETVLQVTADDATTFLATFRNGALGCFMATRLAPGKKNFLRLEIFGSTGSIKFNLERINELEFYSSADDPALLGFRNIIVTEKIHPYQSAWWPPGHAIGWEHSFTNMMKEVIAAVAGNNSAMPTFLDGYKCQEVLDAVIHSASTRRWIRTDTASTSLNIKAISN